MIGRGNGDKGVCVCVGGGLVMVNDEGGLSAG